MLPYEQVQWDDSRESILVLPAIKTMSGVCKPQSTQSPVCLSVCLLHSHFCKQISSFKLQTSDPAQKDGLPAHSQGCICSLAVMSPRNNEMHDISRVLNIKNNNASQDKPFHFESRRESSVAEIGLCSYCRMQVIAFHK